MSRSIRTFLIVFALLSIGVELRAQASDVDCVKCVDTKDIGFQAVTTGKIDQKAVTTSKLAPRAVTEGKIRDGAVGLDKLAPEVATEIENIDSLDQRVQQLEDSGHIEAQVLSAISLASESRYLFAEFFSIYGTFPIDNDIAGAPLASDIQNDFVSSVSINGNVVTATFGNNADPQIQNDTLEFTPNITGNSVYFTCNPTGNVISFFDQNSCVIVDEPPEPFTTIRKQVESAALLMSEARWMVVDYYNHFSVFPSSNDQAGVEHPFLISNAYVVNVTVAGGRVAALFGGDAHSLISGETISFSPHDNGGSIIWACGSLNIHDRYIGSTNCFSPVDPPPQPVTLIREQIRSAHALAEIIQDLVEQYFQANGFFPQNNADAGAPAPSIIQNNYVSSMAIGFGGVITITYGNDAHVELTDFPQMLTPTDNIGSISWECSGGPVDRFNLIECRYLK